MRQSEPKRLLSASPLVVQRPKTYAIYENGHDTGHPDEASYVTNGVSDGLRLHWWIWGSRESGLNAMWRSWQRI